MKRYEARINHALLSHNSAIVLSQLSDLWEKTKEPERVFLFYALASHASLSTHSSSPNASENARTGSTPDAGIKNVAPIDLSGESLPTLRHLSEHAQNLSLLRAATLELNKRRGDA